MEINSLIIIIGTLFILALILFGSIIIAFAERSKSKAIHHSQELEISRQQEISENTLLTQEKERQQIGLELHDDLGPTFSAIRLDLRRIRTQLKKGEVEKADTIATKTSSDLKLAIDKFSNVSRILYPVIFNRNGLKEALVDIVDRYNGNSNIKFSLSFEMSSSHSELIKLVVFRVTQELTTNAIKHSEAGEVSLVINDSSSEICLEYSDDGIGFETDIERNGLGLNSIKGRVEAVRGTVAFVSELGQGLKVDIKIPYDENSNS